MPTEQIKLINQHTIRDLAMGAAVLSAGGGSFPYLEYLGALELLKHSKAVPLIDPSELADDAQIALVAVVGAPLPMFERFVDPDHFVRPVRVLQSYLGAHFSAVMGFEIGSMNGIIPVMVAAKMGLPLVDADTVGRSFPELHMTTFALAGVELTPLALSDVRQNDVIVAASLGGRWAETIARAVTTSFGSIAANCGTCSGATVKRHAVQGTFSRAARLGAAILASQAQHQDPIAALLAAEQGVLLVRGRVTDVERRASAGFVRGRMIVSPANGGPEVTVHFQNEYTVVAVNGNPRVTVPDLICVFDDVRGEPIGTEALRYAQQVAVVSFPATDAFRTSSALEILGPRGFGFDFDYVTPPKGDAL
jgi:DUF917 family protein